MTITITAQHTGHTAYAITCCPEATPHQPHYNTPTDANTAENRRRQEPPMITMFQPGRTYTSPRFGQFTATARTAKFVTLEDEHGQPRRVGVITRNGVEMCYPLGKFSQCPVIFADRYDAT